MVRLKTIRKFKCAIAIWGILAFVIVIGCDLFCDLGLISFSFPQPVVISADHNHEDHHSDGHHHGNQHNHGGHDQDPVTNHHDQSSDEEDCCDDLTQRFYASLRSNPTNNTALAHVQLFKVLSSLFFEDVPAFFIAINLVHTEFQHLPHGPPGISGQVIRVLISSFLI